MKPIFNNLLMMIIVLSVLIIFVTGCLNKPDEKLKHLKFNVQTEVAHQELSTKFCWFHPRAAAIPGFGKNGNPAVIMTIQKRFKVSDYYSGMYYMRTNDLGKT